MPVVDVVVDPTGTDVEVVVVGGAGVTQAGRSSGYTSVLLTMTARDWDRPSRR